MFDCTISSPSYSELIQDHLWCIKPWHRGNIQDLVWHLWFDPKVSNKSLSTVAGQTTQQICHLLSRKYTNSLPADFFYNKYDFMNLISVGNETVQVVEIQP